MPLSVYASYGKYKRAAMFNTIHHCEVSKNKHMLDTHIVHPGRKMLLPYPIKMPSSTLDEMANSAVDVSKLICLHSLKKSFKGPGVYNEEPRCMAVDFSLTFTDNRFTPKLIEAQAFPSLFHLSLKLESLYNNEKNSTLFGRTISERKALLRHWLLGVHHDSQVVMLDKAVLSQMSSMDFILATRDVVPRSLHDIYTHADKVWITSRSGNKEVKRIYNRVIYDTLSEDERKHFDTILALPDIEWVCHPSDYYRYNKAILPYISHPTNPKTWKISNGAPKDVENWVLKPKEGFSGDGLCLHPSKKDIESSSDDTHLLQERVEYTQCIKTPLHNEALSGEFRVMLIQTEQCEWVPICNLVRCAQYGGVSEAIRRQLPGEGATIAVPE